MYTNLLVPTIAELKQLLDNKSAQTFVNNGCPQWMLHEHSAEEQIQVCLELEAFEKEHARLLPENFKQVIIQYELGDLEIGCLDFLGAKKVNM